MQSRLHSIGSLLVALAAGWTVRAAPATAPGYLTRIGPVPLRFREAAAALPIAALPPAPKETEESSTESSSSSGATPPNGAASSSAGAHSKSETSPQNAGGNNSANPSEPSVPVPGSNPGQSAESAETPVDISPAESELPVEPSGVSRTESASPEIPREMLVRFFTGRAGTNKVVTLPAVQFQPPAPASRPSSTATYISR